MSGVSRDRNNSTKCVYCNGPHKPEKCEEEFTVEHRLNTLRCQQRCFRCLKMYHVTRNCYSKIWCPVCNGKHHVTICKGKSQEPAGDGKKQRWPRIHSRRCCPYDTDKDWYSPTISHGFTVQGRLGRHRERTLWYWIIEDICNKEIGSGPRIATHKQRAPQCQYIRNKQK